MKQRFKILLLTVLAASSLEVLVTSCIREELPGINVAITDLKPAVNADGIVRTTIQENGVTMYADMNKVDLSNLPLDITLSRGATYEYVDVQFNTYIVDATIQGNTVKMPVTDTVITKHEGDYIDFSQKRYIKVMAEAEGINQDDKTTQAAFNKFGNIDSETGRLYKIWSIEVLPANFKAVFTFDNWYVPSAAKGYEHPFEYVTDKSGQQKPSYIWASTNNSMAIMHTINPYPDYGGCSYGASSTTETYNNEGKALLLTTNDIINFDPTRQFLTGCMYLGEFDGTDEDELTCTHIGMPFSGDTNGGKPDSLTFWYKFEPQVIAATGQNDQGFIKAVLYKIDDNVSYLTGKTIQDNSFANVVAYAEFYPNQLQASYERKSVPFVYVNTIDENDYNNWKYGLAIYLASSKGGFTFVGAKGTKLYIDQMEVKCK